MKGNLLKVFGRSASIFCPPCFVWRYYDFNKVATGVTMLSYTEMAQLIERS